MAWITPVIAGLSAVLSLITVVLVSRLDSRSEYRKWKRDEQVQAVIELKLAVARLRVKFSRLGEDLTLDGLMDGTYDFSEVNAAMTRVDLVGNDEAVSAVKSLRAQLREFVKSGNSKDVDWRDKRVAVDGTVDLIVGLVRKEVS
jgi:hypothetical protein